LFADDTFSPTDLRHFAAEAYAGFRHAAVTPLVQVDQRLWLLELFHGPTLAFKDLALQLVGHLFEAVLARRAEHVTIIGATSGDTGSDSSPRPEDVALSAARRDISEKAKTATIDWLGEPDSNLRMAESIRPEGDVA
jgi:hypothetical protein